MHQCFLALAFIRRTYTAIDEFLSSGCEICERTLLSLDLYIMPFMFPLNRLTEEDA
jgi:hypothetical protein